MVGQHHSMIENTPNQAVEGQKQLTAGVNGTAAGAGVGTAGVKGTGVDGTAGVNGAPDSLGGQRGGDHEDRGDSTDDRKPDEHLSLSFN